MKKSKVLGLALIATGIGVVTSLAMHRLNKDVYSLDDEIFDDDLDDDFESSSDSDEEDYASYLSSFSDKDLEKLGFYDSESVDFDSMPVSVLKVLYEESKRLI